MMPITMASTDCPNDKPIKGMDMTQLKLMLAGASSLLDIFPDSYGRYRKITGSLSDEEVLRQDWERIGLDIREAARSYEEQHRDELRRSA